jgi:hypothetical protein
MDPRLSRDESAIRAKLKLTSMREIPIFDPARKPGWWTNYVKVSEYAVSHYDLATGSWRTKLGEYARSPEDETILLFDSLADAESYGENYVLEHPDRYCKVFDSTGKEGEPVRTVHHPSETAKMIGLPAAKKRIGWGILWLSVATTCVLADLKITGTVILGAVVGSKFLGSGIIQLTSGIVGVIEHRRRRI